MGLNIGQLAGEVQESGGCSGNFCDASLVGSLNPGFRDSADRAEGATAESGLKVQLDTPYPLRYNARVVRGKANERDKRQFGAEIMEHLDHLYRIAFYLANNEDDARDCVQETCARALASFKQFTPGTHLRAWLSRILYNFFIDAYARNKRAKSAGDPVEPEEPAVNPWERLESDQPAPEERVMQKELAQKVNDALKKIPEEFRAAIVLVDMGDFSYQEAAEILLCPIGTVRSRLSRGRRLLQQELAEYLA
jgi:RNA polymerase sigma-70 factor (ECF subfamily)